MSDYVIYGPATSPFVRKVQAVMHLKGLDYEAENINIFAMPDWYKEISPLRRVPTLRDKTVGTEGVPGTIPDSSAICGYLERKHPEPSMWPDDPYDHGRALWLEEYCDTNLAATGGMGIFRAILVPLAQGKEPDLETARDTWQNKLPGYWRYLEDQLDGKAFFFGDSFSMADIATAVQLMQVDLIAAGPPAETYPGLADFLDRMNAHPAFEANLSVCRGFLSKVVPEKFDLS